MTDNKQGQAAESTGNTNLPTYVAYHIRDTDDGKGIWTRIGLAWNHKDGKGFNIQIEIVPLDGRITLRRD